MRYLLLPFLLFSLISTAICEEYSDYNHMAEILRQEQRRHRDIMSLESIALSPGGRDIFAVTLAAGDAATNPAMLIVGNVEGIDLVASEMCLRFIDEVLRDYGKVDSITRLLDTTTLYVVPRVNPDASEFFFSTPRFESHLNARDLDLDRDGLISEDGPDDLDGDGFITLMRIEDPLGEWITCEDEPRLLFKSKRSEKTTDRYTVQLEGRDNDGDGLFNEDPLGGVDFNSNFSYNYRYFEKGSGPYQLSEDESRGLADFCYEHANIALFFSFSHNSNLLTPWDVTPDKKTGDGKREETSEDQIVTSVSSGDAPYYNELADKFAEITGFKDGPASERGAGAFSEWVYFHFGRISLSVPAWWPPPVEQPADTTGEHPVRRSEEGSSDKGADEKDDSLEYQKRLLHWLCSAGREKDFKDWKPIEHPDFPDQKVEIGGFLPHIAVNPPADSLPALAHIHSRFLLYLAGLMPRIDLVPKVESVHDNVYRITAIVRNTGFLPTNTDLGTRIQWIRKVKAGIELGENMELLSGRKFTLVGSLPGNGGSVEVTWLVLGERGATVKLYAGCPMTGQREEKITLK